MSNQSFLPYIFPTTHRPPRPERPDDICRRGIPDGLKAKLEEAAKNLPADGLCDAAAVGEFLKTNRKNVQKEIKEQRHSEIRRIVGEVREKTIPVVKQKELKSKFWICHQTVRTVFC